MAKIFLKIHIKSIIVQKILQQQNYSFIANYMYIRIQSSKNS